MGRSVPWDVLRVGRLVMGCLVMGPFENGTFQELDLLYVHRMGYLWQTIIHLISHEMK
jgi:hypothetical protein